MNQRTYEWLEEEKKLMWWRDNRLPLSRLELMAVLLETWRVAQRTDVSFRGSIPDHNSPLDDWKEEFSRGL